MRMRHGFAFDEHVLGAHHQRAAVRHGVTGVDQDVEGRDLGLSGVDAAVPQVGREDLLQQDLVAERLVHQGAHAVDQRVHVDGAALEALLPREGQ